MARARRTIPTSRSGSSRRASEVDASLNPGCGRHCRGALADWRGAQLESQPQPTSSSLVPHHPCDPSPACAGGGQPVRAQSPHYSRCGATAIPLTSLPRASIHPADSDPPRRIALSTRQLRTAPAVHVVATRPLPASPARRHRRAGTSPRSRLPVPHCCRCPPLAATLAAVTAPAGWAPGTRSVVRAASRRAWAVTGLYRLRTIRWLVDRAAAAAARSSAGHPAQHADLRSARSSTSIVCVNRSMRCASRAVLDAAGRAAGRGLSERLHHCCAKRAGEGLEGARPRANAPERSTGCLLSDFGLALASRCRITAALRASWQQPDLSSPGRNLAAAQRRVDRPGHHGVDAQVLSVVFLPILIGELARERRPAALVTRVAAPTAQRRLAVDVGVNNALASDEVSSSGTSARVRPHGCSHVSRAGARPASSND